VITLDGSLDANNLGNVSGEFTARVDGGLYASCTVTGTQNSYTLSCQGADADGLSADDDLALDALGEAAGGVNSAFEGMLGPAIGVLGQ
jgi:bacillopeptidase F (M6 metalloprotease family)